MAHYASVDAAGSVAAGAGVRSRVFIRVDAASDYVEYPCCNRDMTSGKIVSALFGIPEFKDGWSGLLGFQINVFYMGSSQPADGAASGVLMQGADTPLSLRPDATDAYIFIDTSAARPSASAHEPASSAVDHNVDELRLRFRPLEVPPPSKASAHAASYAVRRLLAAPLSLTVDASVTAAFRRVVEAQGDSGDWDSLVAGGAFSWLASSLLPPWSAADVQMQTCITPEGPYKLQLPWGCDAERERDGPFTFTRTVKGAAPLHGQLTSACDRQTFDSACVHVLLGLAHSLFGDQPSGTWRFYRRPPAGYALVGFPYTAHFVSVEMVGRLYVAPVSKAFVLGSAEHEAAVVRLEHIDCGPPIDFPWALSAAGRQLHYNDEDDVAWTLAPAPDGCFYKIMSAATKWAQFDRIHKLYQCIATFPFDSAPPAVVRSELLYGFLCVAVRMPFVHGAAATLEQLRSDASLLEALADAIAWLLRHGVLYTDVQGRNLIIMSNHGAEGSAADGADAAAGAAAGSASGGAGSRESECESSGSRSGIGSGIGGLVRLVDYDDALLLPSPVTTRVEAEAAFAAVDGPWRTALDYWPTRLQDAVLGRFA